MKNACFTTLLSILLLTACGSGSASTGPDQIGTLAPVPAEYAGKWLAWDHEETRILAAARTFAEAKTAAEAAGESRPVIVKAPLADVRFVG